jgi:hypothetical protein
MAIGLVLWLAVTATVSGISIHTVGMILFILGAVWLVVELLQGAALGRRAAVYEEPVAYEEPVVYRDRVL